MSVKRGLFAISLLCLVLVLQGCGGGGGGNKPPKITTYIPDATELTVVIGQQQNFSVTATDPDGDALSYSWTKTGGGTLEAGTSNTAKWTAPSEAGEATVKVTVADGKGGVASHTWNITVIASDVKPPVIGDANPETSLAKPHEINVNEEITLSIKATDPQGRTLTSTWNASAGNLKDEKLDTAKWVAPGVPGYATVTVEVTNGVLKASHTFYFEVKGNVVDVTEDITGTKTWASGNIYVIDTRDIQVTGTLKIQPGAIVKFGRGRSLQTSGSGRIEAVGNAQNPIVFTSLRDDSRGGDTNQDQDGTTPKAGDWNQVCLYTKSGNEFEYCEFYYGGGGFDQGMLDLGSSSGTPVKNCTFAFAEGIALNAQNAQKPTIENNVFYLNERPLVINFETSLGDSNTFHNPQAPSEKNEYQGIFVRPSGSSTLTQPTSWAESEAAFVLDDDQWYIEGNGKLTLGPGVTVKLNNAYLAVRSNLVAQGEAGRPVVFTSINDSNHGGDSNGPAADDPSPGDWQYIAIESTAKATFEHCIIAYGGTEESMNDGLAAVSDVSASGGTTIKNAVFRDNLRALDLRSPKSTIANCTFEGNMYPLRVDVNIDTDNTLDIAENDYNAIYLDSDGWSPMFVRQSIKWVNTHVPYILLTDVYTEEKTIYLGSGTTLRVGADLGIYLEQGSRLEGFADAVFTSYRDTDRGGNVGWPGPAEDGDWLGIYDEKQGKWLSGGNIHYAKYPELEED